MEKIYRPEHPNPQFERASWQNLNGSWDFEFDFSRSGTERKLFKSDSVYTKKINVPFCPESKLSGIEYKDFISGCWYRRSFNIEKSQLSGRCILHFGAVDYACTLYINETEIGKHTGGYIGFDFDISEYIRAGENTICLYVTDETEKSHLPCGKQSTKYYSYGCFYTRTTGIWQTVWLEFVPKNYIKSVKMTADIKNSAIICEADICGSGNFSAIASFDGKQCGNYTAELHNGINSFSVPLSQLVLWKIGKGNLYDLVFTLGDDSVKSYFGMREVRLDGYKFLINGKSVFQRLVLDQGFDPEGVYTSPSDEFMVEDINRSLACGFNGARLHEKIFEPRFLYHCDKMGYIVWGEYPDWGMECPGEEALFKVVPEWSAEIKRDYNHPSIIGWCPRNESYRADHYECNRILYKLTKQLDTTRPCIDSSGGIHHETDVFDVHDYEQNPEVFRETYASLPEKILPRFYLHEYNTYSGGATFVSEYGGIAWTSDGSGWGYGVGPKTIEEFYTRFEGLTEVLLGCPYFFGLCYTQITDVEQEQNGLYTYDRKPKFDTERLKKAMSKKAAIED